MQSPPSELNEPLPPRTLLRAAAPAAYAIADFGFFSLANFLVSVMLARSIGASAYGAYAVSFAVQMIFVQLQLALFSDPMLVLMAGRYAQQQNGYLLTLLRAHVWVWTPVCALLVAVTFLPIIDPTLRVSLAQMAVATPFMLLLQLMRRVCYARLSPAVAALGALVYSLIVAGGLALLLFTQRLSIGNAYLILAVASTLVSLGWGFGWLHADPSLPPLLDTRDVLSAHWAYARFSVLGTLLSWIPMNGWYLILPALAAQQASLAASGQLRALVNLMQPMIQINGALGTMLTPTFALELRRDPQASPWRRMGWIIAASVLYCPLLVLAGPYVMRRLYAGAYTAELWALIAIGLVPAAHAASTVTRAFAFARELPQLVLQAAALGTITGLGVGLWFCRTQPLLGAASGMAVAFVTQAVVYVWGLLRARPTASRAT